MVGKGSKLYSIFKSKCPRCQEGEFFVSHPYDLANMGDIHTHCDQCGLKYAKEPGGFLLIYSLRMCPWVGKLV